jgi:glycosyltransferase involved in cell wall biosynthesis
MTSQTTIVHVTHEAAGKIGGIGEVLQGFFTSNSYIDTVDRSIIVGPLFSTEGPVSQRLGENSEVLYSSMDGVVNTGYGLALRRIEDHYNVNIIYGRRTFLDKHTGIKSSPEIILIDIRYIHRGIVNDLKKRLFEKFGIRSDRYEHLWEFDQYVRLAPPAIAILKAMGAAKNSTTVIAHEFMGMPTALAAMLETSCRFKTAFYAHEVATMRRIVEDHPGHDTMFYNAIHQAKNNGQYLTDTFGDQSSYYKHPLVEAAKYCDSICAVGDYAAEELKFMSPEFENAGIDIVYNGIPAYQISLADKLASKEKLQHYCENLLGYRPDFVFTHVTRLVKSKGLWRDLQVLEYMDKEFRTENKTAVLFLLSTETCQRRTCDILNMESAYNWPVAHRETWPDLSGGEANFYTSIQEFNASSRNIKVVFINQFGFSRKHCGNRMPEDMEFIDIRRGSDVEFGLSIYEPFGIAPLEPLTFGGICVVSNVSGCAGFVRDVTNGEGSKNVVIADYISLGKNGFADIEDPLQIGMSVRNQIEDYVSDKIAMQVCARLAKNDIELESMLKAGYELAKNMSWDIAVKDYLLPSLQKSADRELTEIAAA